MNARVAGIAGSAVVLAGCLAAGQLPPEALRDEATSTVVPLGLDLAAPVPDDNPPSAATVDLGRRLFFDAILSSDESASCSTCHKPDLYFTDGLAHGVGVKGREGERNVPSILNVAYGRSFFWDGRAPSLEEQVLEPIQNRLELDLDLAELETRLENHEGYRGAFRRAFLNEETSATNAARALASYLRTLRSGDAPIDRFLEGDQEALSGQAQRGFELFTGKANCSRCHLMPLFTDHRFHNTGVSWGAGDLGRQVVTGRDEDRGAFKVPSLRNVEHTAPYMHDGSLASLEDVIEHYDGGGTPSPYLDEEIRPLRLSDAEKRELIAFLKSLTGTNREADRGGTRAES